MPLAVHVPTMCGHGSTKLCLGYKIVQYASKVCSKGVEQRRTWSLSKPTPTTLDYKLTLMGLMFKLLTTLLYSSQVKLAAVLVITVGNDLTLQSLELITHCAQSLLLHNINLFFVLITDFEDSLNITPKPAFDPRIQPDRAILKTSASKTANVLSRTPKKQLFRSKPTPFSFS